VSFRVDEVGVPVLVRVSYFPNWSVDGAEGPFRVVTQAGPWDGPWRAGVSSFGLGGTNAHVVLEGFAPPQALPEAGPQTLLLSGGAWTPLDLRRTTAALMLENGTDAALIAVCLGQSSRPGPSAGETDVPAFDQCVQAFETLGQHLQEIERLSHSGERQAA
jgi:acyl transferase domain-containing protein